MEIRNDKDELMLTSNLEDAVTYCGKHEHIEISYKDELEYLIIVMDGRRKKIAEEDKNFVRGVEKMIEDGVDSLISIIKRILGRVER